ncbi:MAG: hypothetical protein ACRD1N_00570 [Terriglobia bacterium]
MSYAPAWNATFSKPLLNQMIAVIQRDQAAAIAEVNPALAPIAEFHKGPALQTSFPWLTLTADRIEFIPVFPLTRASRTALTLTLDVGQFDREIALDEAEDYARVLDMIITSASGGDWETALPISQETASAGITAPPQAGSVKQVFVESHRYALASQAGLSAPIVRVALSVLFELQET